MARGHTSRAAYKSALVEKLGGKCVFCGYNKCLSALDFHHVIPDSKRFGIARFISGLSIYSKRPARDRIRMLVDEVSRCVVVCRNCHAELHEKENQGGYEEKEWEAAYAAIHEGWEGQEGLAQGETCEGQV